MSFLGNGKVFCIVSNTSISLSLYLSMSSQLINEMSLAERKSLTLNALEKPSFFLYSFDITFNHFSFSNISSWCFHCSHTIQLGSYSEHRGPYNLRVYNQLMNRSIIRAASFLVLPYILLLTSLQNHMRYIAPNTVLRCDPWCLSLQAISLCVISYALALQYDHLQY